MRQSQVTKVVKKVLPAVVSITISKCLPVFESSFGAQGSPFSFDGSFMIPKGQKKIKVGGGSGFIVDPSGIILTNRHVVADPQAEYIVVLDEEKKCRAKVLARDPINDIAVIKINEKNLPTIKLGDSSKLELGQTAIAIGNVLGTFRNTVSVGVVSGLSREIKASGTLGGKAIRLRGLIQTDAAINPGNSGGPLINAEGKVIGINAAMVLLAENIGFALPINNAKKDLDDLKKYHRLRQPFLGVRYILLNKELQEKFNFPIAQGALVVSEPAPPLPEKDGIAVIPGGAADRAGMKEGDVILEIQKEKITSKNSLEDILQKYKVGQTINLKILRNNKEIISKAVLEERK